VSGGRGQRSSCVQVKRREEKEKRKDKKVRVRE
jgi:hypothetical protein